jgi:HEPN domain-containing protein
MNETDLISEWLDTSRNDYIAAKHLFEDLHPRQVEISAYHSQQSAEKALKAYILFSGNEPPRSHNLDELRSICEQSEAGFAEFHDDCLRLSPYATSTRYPQKTEILQEEAESLIAKSKAIYEYVYSLIPGLDEGLSLDETESTQSESDDIGLTL